MSVIGPGRLTGFVASATIAIVSAARVRLPPRRRGVRLWGMRLMGVTATSALLAIFAWALLTLLSRARQRDRGARDARRDARAGRQEGEGEAEAVQAEADRRPAPRPRRRRGPARRPRLPPGQPQDLRARPRPARADRQGGGGQAGVLLQRRDLPRQRRRRRQRSRSRSCAPATAPSSLSYRLFAEGDRPCCPTGAKVRVLFRLDGEKLAPQTAIPPSRPAPRAPPRRAAGTCISTQPLPSGSTNDADVPHGSSRTSPVNSTPRSLSASNAAVRVGRVEHQAGHAPGRHLVEPGHQRDRRLRRPAAPARPSACPRRTGRRSAPRSRARRRRTPSRGRRRRPGSRRAAGGRCGRAWGGSLRREGRSSGCGHPMSTAPPRRRCWARRSARTSTARWSAGATARRSSPATRACATRTPSWGRPSTGSRARCWRAASSRATGSASGARTAPSGCSCSTRPRRPGSCS